MSTLRSSLAWIPLTLTLMPIATSADEISDLRRALEAQQRLIEELQREVAKLQEGSGGSSETPPVSAGGPQDSSPVTTAYVDERIEDFELAPASRFLLSGYGSAFLVDAENEQAAFGVAFTPSFHFRMSESLHFNAELEIGLEEHDGQFVTEFDLEYAQVDFLALDSLVLSGGRFLTPYNSFGPRLHPTWINKLASAPPIYGGHEGGGFIPVLKSVGALASGGSALWSEDSKMNYGVYVANGVDAGDPMDQSEVLDIDFNNTPNLKNVTAGGRIGLLPIGNLELGVSYMTGDGSRFHLIGGDAWYFNKGLELRGEFSYLTRKASGFEADVWGYWAQAAYRLRYLFPERTGLRGLLNRLEGVVRGGQILDFTELNREQVAFGLNYWLFESAPFKLTYELNTGAIRDDRFFAQFAYGF